MTQITATLSSCLEALSAKLSSKGLACLQYALLTLSAAATGTFFSRLLSSLSAALKQNVCESCAFVEEEQLHALLQRLVEVSSYMAHQMFAHKYNFRAIASRSVSAKLAPQR